ncbi:MAG: sigma-54 dependent transcriptional regulator, partial [Verrucomicrobiota bacterium]
FKTVLLRAQKAAQSDFSVLILGESGTGKEILARTIHRTSQRSEMNFVDINCAAIPDQLIDSELFGYERGSFTGAMQTGRNGLFLEAHRGTLFLDEIADASLQTQAKLLRVLNEGHFRRVGGTRNVQVDVRIIAATNKNLKQMIAEKSFREDLLYRLNTITIHLPALRERPGDIPLLAEFFLSEHCGRQHRTLQFTEECLEVLRHYDWPGNVRELKGVVDYLVTMANGPLIEKADLPSFLIPAREGKEQGTSLADSGEPNEPANFDNQAGLWHKAMREAELKVLKAVLAQAKNRSIAIQLLGISRRTFYAKLKQYGLQ